MVDPNGLLLEDEEVTQRLNRIVTLYFGALRQQEGYLVIAKGSHIGLDGIVPGEPDPLLFMIIQAINHLHQFMDARIEDNATQRTFGAYQQLPHPGNISTQVIGKHLQMVQLTIEVVGIQKLLKTLLSGLHLDGLCTIRVTDVCKEQVSFTPLRA